MFFQFLREQGCFNVVSLFVPWQIISNVLTAAFLNMHLFYIMKPNVLYISVTQVKKIVKSIYEHL